MSKALLLTDLQEWKAEKSSRVIKFTDYWMLILEIYEKIIGEKLDLNIEANEDEEDYWSI